jgi:hypothetical protein
MISDQTFKIQVTQDDINLGVRGQSAHCIVATAIGRQIQNATRIQVDAQAIRFTIGDDRLIYLTPQNVGEYVIAFDEGVFDHIKPMTVTLSTPLVAKRRPHTASRLIVKGEGSRDDAPKAPTRTRSFGQRLFHVNRRKGGRANDDGPEDKRLFQ